MKKIILILLLAHLFFACKRSIHTQEHREYDNKLIHTLTKLEQKYADKKVRINTWDNKAGAYQDIRVLNDDGQSTTTTLTIGDSVKFMAIDVGKPDGIQAKIKLKNNVTGYIPYANIEEFESAAAIDPDLNN